MKDRQEALYGATVVHASFGDVEQAQVSLRGMLLPLLVCWTVAKLRCHALSILYTWLSLNSALRAPRL